MADPIRALCAELAEAVLSDDSHIDCAEIARRARAALAKPADGPAVPEGRGPAAVAEQPRPAPPAEGEVAELARWLRLRNPIDMEGEPDDCTYFMLTRIAELLERHAAMENLAADAVSGLRYIEQSAGRLYGVGWDRVFDAAATLQPAHALPLPAPQGGEVEP